MIAGRFLSMRRVAGIAFASLVLLAGVAASAGPAAAASPWWLMDVQSAPTNLAPGGEGEIVVRATNNGNAPVNGASNPVVISDHLPAGLTITNFGASAGPGLKFTTEGSPTTKLKCTDVGPEHQLSVLWDPGAV